MTTETQLQAFLYRAVTTNSRVRRLVDEGLLVDPPPVTEIGAGPSALDDFSHEARLQARRTGEVYELLHCLENSVRELIERTLREELGEKWWIEGVPDRIRGPAEARRDEELRSRWHGTRGDSLINYVDFPQYGEIIVGKWEFFEDLIGDSDWVTAYFAELNISRRSLAHTGTLTETDVERMEFRVREWLRVVG